MPNRFTNLVPNDYSEPPSKRTFSGAVDGNAYGLNEWATVSKIKKYFNNYLGSLIRGTYLNTITPNRFTDIE